MFVLNVFAVAVSKEETDSGESTLLMLLFEQSVSGGVWSGRLVAQTRVLKVEICCKNLRLQANTPTGKKGRLRLFETYEQTNKKTRRSKQTTS